MISLRSIGGLEEGLVLPEQGLASPESFDTGDELSCIHCVFLAPRTIPTRERAGQSMNGLSA